MTRSIKKKNVEKVKTKYKEFKGNGLKMQNEMLASAFQVVTLKGHVDEESDIYEKLSLKRKLQTKSRRMRRID